jgi:hypothetical protein
MARMAMAWLPEGISTSSISSLYFSSGIRMLKNDGETHILCVPYSLLLAIAPTSGEVLGRV